MLVYQGVNDVNMRRARLTTDELMEAIREHGWRIEDVNPPCWGGRGISVLMIFRRRRAKPFKKCQPKKQTKKQG